MYITSWWGNTQILYLSSLVRWATEEYFEPVTCCEPHPTKETNSPANLGLALPADSTHLSEGSIPTAVAAVPKAQRPNIKYVSVPSTSDLTAKYPQAQFMFQVSQPIINAAIVSSSKEGKGENGILEALRASSVANVNTMRKQGMNPHTLHVLSVAGSETLKATLQEVRKRFNTRVDCPINMAIMKHYIQSWMIEDDGHGIKYFIGLEVFHGYGAGEAYARRFNVLDDIVDHSKAYLSLVEKLDFKRFSTDLNVMKDAARNVLLLLFIMNNMRFCFQSAMLDALDRLFFYIKKNDFGPSSTCSADFIRLCLVEFFNCLDDFRSRLSESRDDSDSLEMLDELEFLPHLEDGSPIVLIQQLMYFTYGRNVAQLLISGSGKSPSASNEALDTKDSKTKSERNKEKKDKKKAKLLSRPSNPLGTSAQVIHTNNVNPPVGKLLNAKRKIFCLMFNSKKGCQFGSSCRFTHEIPLIGSSEWNHLEGLFSDRGVEASASFVAGGP